MFNRPPRLSVRRPSGTTVLFTVSNAPSRDTISSQTLFYLGILFRCVVGLCVVLIDAAKGRNGVFFQDDSLAWDLLWATPPGLVACSVADQIDWKLLTIGSIVLTYLVFRKGYTGRQIWTRWPKGSNVSLLTCFTEESLLVLRGLGIETSTSSPSYLSTATTRFIPTTLIQDIVIHEAFKGFEVRFYLAVVVSEQTEVVVVFPVSYLTPLDLATGLCLPRGRTYCQSD